jgi:DNA-directed RNA polymerase-3 subunit RPC5
MPVKIKAEPKVEPKADDHVAVDETVSADPQSMDVDLIKSGASDVEDDEEDEEVVREIDVYLSPELADQIYLMQFPLTQKSLGFPLAARVRPQHCMVELDHKTPDDIDTFGQYHMPARTYISHTVPVLTHMALGKLSDQEGAEGLHLVPLSRIAQMRPSFAHVDDATSNATSTTDEEIKRQQAEEAKVERKPLAFQKKESERAALARKSSYAYKKASEEDEIWQSLDVYGQGSTASLETFQKVVCPHPTKKLTVDPGKNPREGKDSLNKTYVRSLNYLPLASKGEDEISEKMDLTSVVTKLVGLMQQGWPIPYSLLRRQFQEPVTDKTLFVGLTSCAFLVRGNFILQSRFLPMSPAVTQARTFILFLLQTIEVVHRTRLEYVYKGDDDVNSEVILMLLNEVGKITAEGWTMKIEDGVEFVEKYPEAVTEHLQFWGNQVRRFSPLLERYRVDPVLIAEA